VAISAHLIQTSFNGGELSRRLHSRVDAAIYRIGASEITNMIATIEGPLVKTPGTRFRALALASAAWLGKFVFNATQAYLIEYSNLKVRFLTNDALLAIAGVPVEVVTPYTAAEAAAISTTQSGDVLYMAHGSHPPAALSRTAADAFNHAALALAGGPFKDANTNEGVTVTAAGAFAVGGAITITASSAIFLAGHVGAPFRIEGKDFSNIPAWEAGIDGVAIGNIKRSDDKAYVAATAGRTGSIQPTHVRGTEYDGMATGTDVNAKGPFGIQWTYKHDRFGTATITAIGGGGTTATATVTRAIPDSVGSVATHRWAHGLFSAAEGWPHLVFKWKGRLGFIKGFDLVLSVAGSYRDFSEENESGAPTPDQAIRKTIDSSDPILWVKPDRELLLGTNLGEYKVSKVNPSEPLSGDNIEIVPQTYHGSAAVEPLQIGGVTIFVQRGGRKLRAAEYRFENDRYAAANMTIWARQITRGGILQLAHQGEPEELLWGLRGDGALVAHAYMPEQEVKGFTIGKRMEDATILSIQAMPSTDGTRDDLWALVERNGLRSHECLDRWWDEDEGRAASSACFVDGALSYSGAAATIFTGFDHLDGMAAMVLADGAEVSGLSFGAVTGGIGFVLPTAAAEVTGGMAYTARVTTLKPEVPRPDGTSQGRLKKLVKLILRVIDTFGIRAGVAGGDTLENVFDRQATDPMDRGPSLINGDSDPLTVGGGWTNDGRATIESRSPFPWILGAAISGVEEGDR
jgi:hypothetical protein